MLAPVAPADAPAASPVEPPAVVPAPAPSPAAPTRRPPPVEPIEVTVESVPSGAQIVLGGNVLGKTPYHSTLPRRRTELILVVRLAGYVDRTIVAPGNAPISERVRLTRSAPASHPKTNRDQSVNPFAD
ncbi:MAG TPA: PEGA domain-containing protein [Kofleriaceae bacterium]|nr:PEGA domain-containing protein [Kofleriaceae bacterium]